MGCFLLLGAILPCAWLGWSYRESRRDWTAGQIERLIGEELPGQYGKQEAIAWFQSHGFRYHVNEVKEGERLVGQVGDKTFAEIAGLNERELGCAVWSWVQAANVHWFLPGRITVVFFFDKRGGVAGTLVMPFVYAL